MRYPHSGPEGPPGPRLECCRARPRPPVRSCLLLGLHVSRTWRAGVGAAAEPRDPPGEEFVETDGLAAGHVERIGRDPTGGFGDDRAKIGLLDQSVDVDALRD